MNPIVHDMAGTLWCGTAALSAITGLRTSAFAGLNAAGKAGIGAMRDTLRHHGWCMSEVTPDICLHVIEPLSLCIVDEGRGHWVVVCNGMLADSGNCTPVPIRETRFDKSEVRWQYTITRI